MAKQIISRIWTIFRQISRKSEKGTNTIIFVTHNNIPVGHTVTYSQIVVKLRPQKEDPIRVRFTVGGNCIEYSGKVTTKTADLTTFKLNIHLVLSTHSANDAGRDIINYYLVTPMERS